MPAEIAEARGNPGRRKRRTAFADAVPVLAAEGPEAAPPPQLSEPARQVWQALAPELARLKLLRTTDGQAFARYCDTLARYWEVTRELDKLGDTYVSKSQHGTLHRLRPQFIVQDRLARRLIDLEDRFGLSPAARQRILLQLAAATVQPNLPFGGKQPVGAADELPGAEEPASQPASSPIGLLGRSVH